MLTDLLESLVLGFGLGAAVCDQYIGLWWIKLSGLGGGYRSVLLTGYVLLLSGFVSVGHSTWEICSCVGSCGISYECDNVVLCNHVLRTVTML